MSIHNELNDPNFMQHLVFFFSSTIAIENKLPKFQENNRLETMQFE